LKHIGIFIIKEKIAYISSPFRGDTYTNTEKARKYSRIAYEHGYTPIAPHLLLPQFMDDNVPAERIDMQKISEVLIRKSYIMFVCGDVITDDMKSEMMYARKVGLTVVPLDGITKVSEYLEKEQR